MRKHELDDMEVIIVEDPADRKKREELEAELDKAFKKLHDILEDNSRKFRKKVIKMTVVNSVLYLAAGVTIGIAIDRKYL